MRRGLPILALLTTCAAAQEPPRAAEVDWAKEVDKACTSPRYGLRLAASKKVAQGGDAAVPAVRAFAQQKGRDALPVALVEAFADGGGNGGAVLDLLAEWSQDRDFYWRGQALRGLALRSRTPALGQRFAPLFAALGDDPAWLVRVHARLGLALAPVPQDAAAAQGLRTAPVESDPRARTRLATLRAAQGLPFSPVDLLDALGDERTFLGDPWGRRRAQEALAALQTWLGDACGYRADAAYAANRAAIEQLVKLAAQKSGLPLATPPHHTDQAGAAAGGIEILSCRNGDLFLCWTAAGVVRAGLDAGESVALSATAWRALSESATALALAPQSGVVICDKLRIQLHSEGGQGVVAPASLPQPLALWLKQLAARIEESGNPALASALSDRLQQFAAR